jgi:purine-cytosine permease-like protein
MCGALNYEPWGDAYNSEELGGLLGAVLQPLGGFGKFLLVVFTLSIVANNIINVYSFPLSLMVITKYFVYVPQFVFVLLITGIYIPIAIVGATHFATSLENFMNVLGYWLAIFSTVLFEEHIIFRKRDWKNYDALGWNDPKSCPWGLAAAGAFCFGVAGAVVGMAQSWWVGPIAMDINAPFGGDIGFILAAVSEPLLVIACACD